MLRLRRSRPRCPKPNWREAVAPEAPCLLYVAGSPKWLRTSFRQRLKVRRKPPKTLQETVTVTNDNVVVYFCYSLESFLECVVSLFEAPVL